MLAVDLAHHSREKNFCSVSLLKWNWILCKLYKTTNACSAKTIVLHTGSQITDYSSNNRAVEPLQANHLSP